jgi:phage gp29-like protein
MSRLGQWFGFGQAERATAKGGLPPYQHPPNPAPSQPGSGHDSNLPFGAGPPEGHYTDFPVSNLGGWDTGRIQTALNGHQLGNFAQSALLSEAMMGDDRMQTAMNGRAKGVTARHLHTVPSKRDKKRVVRRAVERVWRKVFSDEVLDQFIMWWVLMGFVLCEVQWTTEDDPELGTIVVPYLKIWHPSYVWYDVAARRYVAITQEGNVYIEENDPHWFLLTPWGEYRGWLRGAVRACAPPWLIRQYSRRDWARYCEVHGLPIKLVDVPAQASWPDKNRMFAQVRNMGAQTTILLPQQGMGNQDGQKFDVRLLEAKDESWAAFPGLIRNCDMAIQLAIRGTNLTSEVQGGSYAAAQVHSDEDTAYGDSDCRKLCSAATRLMRLFCAYNFGDADLCPGLSLEQPDKQDKAALAQSQVNAVTVVREANTLGIPIDVRAYFEQYDIPILGVDDADLELESADEGDVFSEDDAAIDLEAEVIQLIWRAETEALAA